MTWLRAMQSPVGASWPAPLRKLHFRGGLALLLLVFALAGCVTKPPAAPPAVVETPPAALREFRAAWVATVANIDWPSRTGLSQEQQRAEILAILDRARALNLNAIILQVRPAADALYASPLEPWSEYLTGTQGRDPGYDPLAVWVEEAHRRGLELHAWFNPYRARHHEAKSPLAESHLAKTNPEVVKRYGELLWMDPGEPVAAARTLAVVRDVVRRYDVDGIHLDDYFYPYPIARALPPGVPKDAPREEIDFPDDLAWRRYLQSGGNLSRADWRRHNVDQLVEQIHRVVHEEKPWVRFGISPFGLGRPDRRPPGIEGFSQYDKLSANVELWLEHGWLDYLTPQLYWSSQQRGQDFGVLLAYWSGQNKLHRHLWPGLFASAINDTPKSWQPAEILHQIELVHAQPAASGHVLFSLIALMQDRRGLSTRLRAGLYRQAALVPATPWLGGGPVPAAPTLERNGSGQATIHPAADSAVTHFAIWRRYGAQWFFAVQSAVEPVIALAPDPTLGPLDAVVVSAVDRLGLESTPAALRLTTRRP